MHAIWAMVLLYISAVPALAEMRDRFRRLQHLCNEQRPGAGFVPDYCSPRIRSL